MAAAYVFDAYTLQPIAAYFGVHSSTVSRAVRRAGGQQPAEHPYMNARPDPISTLILCAQVSQVPGKVLPWCDRRPTMKIQDEQLGQPTDMTSESNSRHLRID